MSLDGPAADRALVWLSDMGTPGGIPNLPLLSVWGKAMGTGAQPGGGWACAGGLLGRRSERPPTQTPDPNKPTSEVPTQAPPPTDPPIDPANLCEIAKNKVPAAVIAAAQANPQSVAGYGLRCNPNLAGSPLNPPRTWLSLRTPSLPFHPLFNGLTWKCGCP